VALLTGRVKLLHVVGARPNFMKAAPLVRALRGAPEFDQALVHTGQHYDDAMSGSFFEELDLPRPDLDLGVGSASHARQTAEIMIRFEQALSQFSADWVVVVGDVNSTLACTLVASKLGVRVAHVEAGLRSFDRSMPEEINRVVTDALADLLFTPSRDADENLRREGIPLARVRRVGNIMIDTLCHELRAARDSGVVASVGVEPRSYLYVTLHRPANVDSPASLEPIVAALQNAARSRRVVFPVHPRTRSRLVEHGLLDRLIAAPGVKLLDPLSYRASLALTDAAACVLTDSGGLQEETTFLGVPCLTLRPNTERPITLTEGTNRLTSLARLSDDLEEAAGRKGSGAAGIPELWDGHTAERVVSALREASHFVHDAVGRPTTGS